MDNEQLVRELSQPLHAGRGWLTFLGIVSIGYGTLMALSIVGLLIAWIPIWAGILLLQAGNALAKARDSGDRGALMRASSKLKTYFVIWGVIALLGLLMSIPALIFGFNAGIFTSSQPFAA